MKPTTLDIILGRGLYEIGVSIYGKMPALAIYPLREPDADGRRVGSPTSSPLVKISFAEAAAVEIMLSLLRSIRDNVQPPLDANGIVPVPDEPLIAALGGDLTEARTVFESYFIEDLPLTERAEDGFGYRFHSTAAQWVGFLRGVKWMIEDRKDVT